MLKSFVLHFRLAGAYLAQFIKTRMDYRVDFLTGLAGTLIVQLIGLVFIEVIFQKTPTLHEWTRAEVFLIYGLFQLPVSIFSVFFTNLYFFSSTYIVEGNMDRILLRPLNNLFQICLERVRIEALSSFFTGLAVIVYASAVMDPPLHWTATGALLLLLFTVSGTLVLIGLFVACASMSFWFTDRVGLLPPLYNMLAFGRYPLDIYHPRLQWLLTWILPVAFVGFFPATHFLHRVAFHPYVLLTPIVAIGFYVGGMAIWRQGLRRYESTGS